jgi:hypothetical protein
VARSTLEKETHRCADTQRKYERIEGVSVQHNYVAAPWTQEDLPIPDGAETWECVDEGVPSVLWQAPNTYKHAALDKARPGMTRRIARNLRRHLDLRDEVERRERFLYDAKARLRQVRGDMAIQVGKIRDGRLFRFLRVQPVKRYWTGLTLKETSPVSNIHQAHHKHNREERKQCNGFDDTQSSLARRRSLMQVSIAHAFAGGQTG